MILNQGLCIKSATQKVKHFIKTIWILCFEIKNTVFYYFGKFAEYNSKSVKIVVSNLRNNLLYIFGWWAGITNQQAEMINST